MIAEIRTEDPKIRQTVTKEIGEKGVIVMLMSDMRDVSQTDETQGSTTEDKTVKMDRPSTHAARGECEQIQIDS
jgi:hypothetical protein